MSVENACQIVVDKTYQPHWRESCDEKIYHADKTAVNSSSLKMIHNKSPFAFKRSFIDGVSKPPTDSMKFGTLAHLAILEGARFRESYIVMPEFVGYTKDGKVSKLSAEAKAKREEWVAEQHLSGKTIVTQEELDKLLFMVEAVTSNEEAVKLLSSGATEISGYYADPETGILCRIRPDFLSFDLNAMIDVKTIAKCDMDYFRRNRVEDNDFMYYFQMAMYDEGTSIISNKKVDFPVWILVGSEPPYECIVIPMEEVYREIGNTHYKKALKKLKECIDKKEWPRSPNMMAMQPTHWFMQKQEIEG